MDAIFPSKVQLAQGASHPLGVHGNVEVGNMDITVQQTTFIERALLAMHLSLDFTRAQVQDEEPFQTDAPVLDATREYNHQQSQDANGYHDGIGEMGEVGADIEDKGYGNDATHQDGKQQWQTVAVALSPQGPELQTAILLHHHRTEEGRDEQDGQQTRDGVGILYQVLSRQQLKHEGAYKGKHDGDGC